MLRYKIVFLLLLGAWQWAFAEVSQHVLQNGLRIIVHEDHRSPTVGQMLWFKVGSVDENSSIAGISHFLEHMMFKGPDGEESFAQQVDRLGGVVNAFTGRNYTAYFERFHRSQLATVMRMEAERMRRLAWTPKQLELERAVILEERRWRVEDEPLGILYEKLYETAFLAHPYRFPIIGWRSSINAIGLEDLQDWYHLWYRPDNAVLVISGDVVPETVFSLAKQYFGQYPASANIIETVIAKPQVQTGMRSVLHHAKTRLPSTLMGWHVPRWVDFKQKDPISLAVLSAVLTDGSASRLFKAVVQSGLAVSVNAHYDLLSRSDNLFVISMRAETVEKLCQTEKAVHQALADLVQQGIEDQALQAIKTKAVAQRQFGKDSAFGQAMVLGILAMTGFEPDDEMHIMRLISEVSSQQLQMAVSRVLVDSNLTVARLIPQGSKWSCS